MQQIKALLCFVVAGALVSANLAPAAATAANVDTSKGCHYAKKYSSSTSGHRHRRRSDMHGQTSRKDVVASALSTVHDTLVPPPPPDVPLLSPSKQLAPLPGPSSDSPRSASVGAPASKANPIRRRNKKTDVKESDREDKNLTASNASLSTDTVQVETVGHEADGGADSASSLDSLSETYRLEPGDVLNVVDPTMGTTEAPSILNAPVGPDGTIYVYPYGKIMARGKTIASLTKLLNRIAAQYTDQPEIVVELVRQRPIYVYVLGEVISPGLWNSYKTPTSDQEKEALQMMNSQQFPNTQMGAPRQLFTPLLNGSQAQNMNAQPLIPPATTNPAPSLSVLPLTALTAIQMAGGVRDTADIHHIRITRRTAGKTFEMDLWKMLVDGDFTQDRLLQTGDSIYVPRSNTNFDPERLGLAANTFKYVRVWGEVRAPGLYILQPQDDLYSVIARAGGFTAVAGRRLELSRQLKDGSVTTRSITIDPSLKKADKIMREKIMPGDVLVARANTIKKYGPSVLNRLVVGAGAAGLVLLSRGAGF